jgi:hypothetical protein
MMDESEVRRVEVALQEKGWAKHASLERELRLWAQLAQEVNAYPLTVDDYTNDLCSRDYIAEAASRASGGLREAIEDRVAAADDSFRTATVEDDGQRLGRYYRIDKDSAWWWHRRPSFGPLADYLSSE